MKKFVLIMAVAILLMAYVGCKKQTKVLINTSKGEIHIELFDDTSPETVSNFLQYTDKKFYDGTIFHRVVPNFMI